MRTLFVLALAVIAVPAVVAAQPEDRRRAPTAPAPTTATADPCADAVAADRMRGPSAAWPGFDPRAPLPAGATAWTGAAPPGRDPSRGFPQPPQPDQAYQTSCPPRLSR
jgi:hypothetical protein